LDGLTEIIVKELINMAGKVETVSPIDVLYGMALWYVPLMWLKVVTMYCMALWKGCYSFKFDDYDFVLA
jgi:hypothetical protein